MCPLGQLLKTLNHLPITTKNQIEDNKILAVVQKWAAKEEDTDEIKQESVDHTPIVSPYSPDAANNTTPSRNNDTEEESLMQEGEGEIDGPSVDAQLPMDSDPVPESVQLQMGGEGGWQDQSREDQSTTNHRGAPDETPQDRAQAAIDVLIDKFLPAADGDLSGEGAVEGLGGLPSEGPMGEPPPLPAEDAPTGTATLDLHASASGPGGAPESLQGAFNGKPTTILCGRADEHSPAITALDVGGSNATGFEGFCVAENTNLASPESAKEEEEEDTGPTVSVQLSPVYSDTEQVPLPLQQDPPPNPVSSMEVVSMAVHLLDRWQDLKEVFKIPKKKPNPSGQQEELVSAATSVSSWWLVTNMFLSSIRSVWVNGVFFFVFFVFFLQFLVFIVHTLDTAVNLVIQYWNDGFSCAVCNQTPPSQYCNDKSECNVQWGPCIDCEYTVITIHT